MKLRYYLRGLGLGVTLTAIIMGVALGNPSHRISDEEIIKRAKQLGMVEAESTLSSYSETAKNPEVTEENDNAASDTKVDKTGEEIFEKIHEDEPQTADSTAEMVEEASENGAAGESSESIESEEDVKLASDDAAKTASTDIVEAEREENSAAENTKSTESTAKENTKSTENAAEAEKVTSSAGTDSENTTTEAKNTASANEDTNKNDSISGKTTLTNVETKTSQDLANDTTSAQNTAENNSSVAQNTTENNSSVAQSTTDSNSSSANASGNSSVAASGDVNYIVVVLPSGSESDDCARILREAGVLEDGIAFNKYLVNSGQDRRIRSGTKQIPKGSSFEEIASIITK